MNGPRRVAQNALVRIAGAAGFLEGELALPLQPAGVVLFAHGSGSSRHSPRNLAVAAQLREAGLGTLLWICSARRRISATRPASTSICSPGDWRRRPAG